MIGVVIAFLAAMLDPHTAELAAGARATAPTYLTAEASEQHATAAATAARVYGVDAAILLSIAWHESRFVVATVTPESGGRVSCGPLTPEPITACAHASMLGGYLSGARHLRGWLDAERGDLRAALTGYAGGYALIAACARGEDRHGCVVPAVFLERARAIRAGRTS